MGFDDTDLVQRWQKGDPRAFEELVRRWEQSVARFLYRFTGRSDLIPDLCQEVFLRAYLAGPRFRGTAAFSTWLYRIALNLARDAGRRIKRPVLPLEEHDQADRSLPASHVCEQQELEHAVSRAVAELPEPLRVVLVLHHYEQMNFEEMARLLDAPASTLKSRFATALRRLRERLPQLGFGPEENQA